MSDATQTILITGAARRIGATLARALAAPGVQLILHYHESASAAKALARELEDRCEREVALLKADLGDFAASERLADAALAIQGRVDVLINNASTFFPTPLGEIPGERWDSLMNVNARAPFALIQKIGAAMKARGRGHIVNLADDSYARPELQFIPYAASKAALVSLTLGFARALAPEVQVNALLLGPMLWPEDYSEEKKAQVLKKIPLKRAGDPQEVVKAVEFLLKSGSYCSGTLLQVNGGRHLV